MAVAPVCVSSLTVEHAKENMCCYQTVMWSSQNIMQDNAKVRKKCLFPWIGRVFGVFFVGKEPKQNPLTSHTLAFL